MPFSTWYPLPDLFSAGAPPPVDPSRQVLAIKEGCESGFHVLPGHRGDREQRETRNSQIEQRIA